MKGKLHYFKNLLSAWVLTLLATAAYAQQSTNTIKYQLTYDAATSRYTVWVVPDYSTPNAFNTGTEEKGGTAQVTLKVPQAFSIVPGSVININGDWTSPPAKLNGGTYGLDASFSYLIFGKAPEETNYGSFVKDTPVALFSFLGNSCYGQIGVLAKGDPFVAAALAEPFSLNVGGSFYSKSGQPGVDTDPTIGGNQEPLEQFIDKLGPDTECRSDLMLTKTVSNSTPNVGTNVVFTITVSNAGPGVATGVVVSDQLPSGYTFVSDDGATAATYDVTTGLWTIGTIASGSSAILNITAKVNPAGLYLNYAQVSASNDLDIDSSPGNGPQTPDEDDDDQVTTVPVPVADLSITKTDGSATYTPGTTTTYTIVVSNAGPSDVVGAAVADALPTGVTWNYTSTGTTGTSGNTATGTASISDLLTLPSGSSVTYEVLVTIPAGFTGNLVNTATVTAPTGVTDNSQGNNTVTDTDTRNSLADLSITKSDGSLTYTPGISTTYTIMVSNAGPSDVVGATVADAAPAGTSITSWSAVFAGGVTGTVNGSGNLSQTVNVPSGGSATYTVVLAVPSGFTGSLVNTATVTAPTGVTDNNQGNNTVTDTDTQNSLADLSITKTDGSTTYTPGTSTTYTIVVSNAGPSDVVGATVADAAPAGTSITSWSAVFAGGATGTVNGSGNLSQTVNVPSGGSATYTVVLAVPSGFTGNLVNTATVAAPTGVTDNNQGNNTVTDTDTQNSLADLSITKTDGSTTYTPGTSTTYTIVVSNLGPSDVVGATVADALPAGVTWNYISTGTQGTSGNTATGTASISDLLTLPSGSSVTYLVVVSIPAGFTGNLVNTATVTAPNGVTDNSQGNNTVTDTDTQNTVADLAIVKKLSIQRPEPGANVTFTLVVKNNGPSVETGVVVADLLPTGFTYVSDDGAGAYTGGIWTIGTLANGGITTLQIVATINATGSYSNTAVVSGNNTANDPNTANNTSTASLEQQILLPKVYLQGSLFGVTYSSGTTVDPLMRDDLRVKNLIPLTSPYSGLNPTVTASTIAASVLTTTGSDAIVDWVFVELRDVATPTLIVSSRSALLQRDGDIVDLDGILPIPVRSPAGSAYYIAVRHRNHLAVMTASAVVMTTAGTTIDFRQASTPTYRKASTAIHQSQVDVLQGKALWAGNALSDNAVIYQGTSNDVNPIYQQVIGPSANPNPPFKILKGYETGDINMNGEVIFQGTRNDVEYIYQNVIRNHPGNTFKATNFIIQQQLPE